MAKEEIAKVINARADLARIIVTNFEMDFKEGSIYDNQGKVESWSDRDRSTAAFIPESTGSLIYVLYCDQVPCHAVNYNDEEESEMLGATDCESEAECLVLPEQKMRITYVSSEDDFKEMGYYVVELELAE